jgi:hypothetical protein
VACRPSRCRVSAGHLVHVPVARSDRQHVAPYAGP